ncbi:MAG: type II secretion system F family protein [Patescibacteria group bacterium]
MALYSYIAKDREGKTFTGLVDAPGTEQAITILHDRGWVVTSLDVKESPKQISFWLKKFQRVSEGEKTIFTRQLATMIEAGLPIDQALGILTKQLKNDRMREILETASHDVEGGLSLSASLSKYPEVFDRIYVNLIKAGEASGALDKVLSRLADVGERNREFTSSIKQAMIYPIIVFTAMGGVFTIMIVFVLPKLTDMYKDMGVALPLPTQIMLGISQFVTNQWWLLLAILATAGAGFYYYSKTAYGQYQLAYLSLKTPILGSIIVKTNLAQFSRTLSWLVSAGLPFLECLEIVSQGLSNLLFRNALKDAAKQVERGINLSVPLRNNPLFPPILSQMLVVGEETGRIDEVMLKISNFFESDVERSLKNITVALEPLIMILLGLVVGVLVFSIVTPIYKLTSAF